MERRIHFVLDDSYLDSVTDPALTEVTYENDTGRLVSAVARIDPARAASLPIAAFTKLLGYALGLQEVSLPLGDNQRSIMEPLADPPEVLAPTEADRTAICALYGLPSYCGE